MDKDWAAGDDGDGGEYVPSDDDTPRPRSRLRKGGKSKTRSRSTTSSSSTTTTTTSSAASSSLIMKKHAVKSHVSRVKAPAQPPAPKMSVAPVVASSAPAPSLNAYLAKQRTIPKRDKATKRRQQEQKAGKGLSGATTQKAAAQGAVATANAVAMSMGIVAPHQSGGASQRQQRRAKRRKRSDSEDAQGGSAGAASTASWVTAAGVMLERGLVEWDIIDALRSSGNRSTAAQNQNQNQNRQADTQPRTRSEKLSNSFSTAQEYVEAWAPLCVSEAKAQVLNDVLTGGGGRRNATHRNGQSGLFQVRRFDPSGTRPDSQEGGFALLQVTLTAPWVCPADTLIRNSLVYISGKDLAPMAAARGPQSHAGGGVEDDGGDGAPSGVVGLVVSPPRSAEGLMVRVSSSNLEASIPGASVIHGAADHRFPAFLWHLSTVTTSLREFDALLKLHRSPMLRQILGSAAGNPADEPSTAHGAQESALAVAQAGLECSADAIARRLGNMGSQYVAWLNSSFNRSQLGAIAAAAQGIGRFTLVQGPPGTGKTTTLVGLLNTLHQRDYNAYFAHLLDRAHKPQGVNSKASRDIGGGHITGADGAQRRRKPHILVAAPSNVAVDGIVERLMERGFIDGRGGRYNPHIARIGSGSGDAVRAVSVEEMSDRLGSMPDGELDARLAHVRHTLAACQGDEKRLRQLLHEIKRQHRALVQQCVPSTVRYDADESNQGSESEGEADNPFSPLAHEHKHVRKRPRRLTADGGGGAGNEQASGESSDANESGTSVGSATFSDNMDTTEGADGAADADATDADADADADGLLSTLRPGSVAAAQPQVRRPTLSAPPAAAATAATAAPAPQTPPPLDEYTPYVRTASQYTQCVEMQSTLDLERKRLEYIRAYRTQNSRGGRTPRSLSRDARVTLETSLLDTAHIVCTTLSGTGLEAFETCEPFDVLIVDEAAQSVELSTLVPLRLGIRQCILVGDPKQLPATVFNRGGARSGYDRSLFERLASPPISTPTHLLDTQYRMHPAIAAFPSRYFYEARLQDAPCVRTSAWQRPWHSVPPFSRSPLLFLDLAASSEQRGGVSRSNPDEVTLCVSLLLALEAACPSELQMTQVRGAEAIATPANRIGVLTPYTEQLRMLQRRCTEALGKNHPVAVSTVDGFQGREKDVIIFSCVRSAAAGTGGGPRQAIGFLDDLRRMNVALTRARYSLFVVGSAETLSISPHWRALIDHCDRAGALLRIPVANCDLFALDETAWQRPPQRMYAAPASSAGASAAHIDFGAFDD